MPAGFGFPTAHERLEICSQPQPPRHRHSPQLDHARADRGVGVQVVDHPGPILADPGEARAMARRGKEHVRRCFLTPRLLRDWLALMHHFDGEQVDLEFHSARV